MIRRKRPSSNSEHSSALLGIHAESADPVSEQQRMIDDCRCVTEAAGWQVRTSITKTVDYVVTGSMVGSGQLAKAWELGIAVLDEDGFRGRV